MYAFILGFKFGEATLATVPVIGCALYALNVEHDISTRSNVDLGDRILSDNRVVWRKRKGRREEGREDEGGGEKERERLVLHMEN